MKRPKRPAPPPTLAELQGAIRELVLSSKPPAAGRRTGRIDAWVGLAQIEQARILCRDQRESALRRDFPAVAQVLGPVTFGEVMAEYLLKHPSRSFNSRNLGWKFAGFLSARSGAGNTAGNVPYLGDLAAFEWELALAGCRDRRAPLDDGEVPRNAKFGLDPSVRLLRTRWVVEDILSARRGKERSLAPSSHSQCALIYRHPLRGGMAVSLSEAQFLLLEGIRRGVTLERLSEELVRIEGARADAAVILAGLGEWVKQGVLVG